jgi:pectin methylesterase-like acyl-CoA thioesterase
MKKLLLLTALTAATLSTGAQTTLFPARNAVGVNVDTHLVLTFDSEPTIGTSGFIRVFEQGTDRLVDCLDLSIPAGPTERRQNPEADYTKRPYEYTATGFTNANTEPGTPSGTNKRDTSRYQLNIIGGFTDGFHFYPVIVHERTATIYLHNNLLEYGKSYYVTIDPGVIAASGFEGIDRQHAWRFSTRESAPTDRQLVVSADGRGDFNTVQGALDHIPDFTPLAAVQTTEDTESAGRWHIFIRNGVYEEIVYFRNKRSVTIEGESRDGVLIHYANCEVFNPHPWEVKTNENVGTFPSRRASFMCDNSYDITLMSLTLRTDRYGQAEGLLIMGGDNKLYDVTIIGTGDALQVNGTTYFENCTIDGAGDTIMGRGPAFFRGCTITSAGYILRPRNTAKNHGYVFVDCRFTGKGGRDGGPTVLGRSPMNETYPAVETVLIDCTLENITPEAWGPIEYNPSAARLWEYNSRGADGKPVDVSRRHPATRQLDAVKDAELIRRYRNPFYVLETNAR